MRGAIIHSDPDDDEIRYIIIDNAHLRSGGVIVDDMLDDDGRLSGARMGYVFYHLNDNNDDIPLFAQPKMLDRHCYNVPSPIEARVRLEHKWPVQLEMIDTILVSGNPLPQRISSIAEALEQELTDASFRELVELYVNDELELHMKTPYMTVVKNRIDSLGDIDDENAQWAALNIQGLLTLFIHAPEIRFSSVTEAVGSKPQGYIFAQSFNDEFGDKPEMVGIAAENIERFLSTKAATSLGARAIDAMDQAMEDDMRAMIEHTNEVSFLPIEDDANDAPEYIYQLEDLEQAFRRIQKIADEYLTHTFTSQEDARRDANLLLEKAQEELKCEGFAPGLHVIEVMGENVKAANLRFNLHWDEAQNILVHGVDKDEPVVKLPLGDRAIGTAEKLYAVVESTFVSSDEGEADGVIFYTPRIVMGIVTSQEVGYTVEVEPVLSQLMVKNQASVPFDSSSDIHFTVLEQYRESRNAVERARSIYGENSPLMNRIYELNEALNRENPNDFIPLEPTVLSRFGVDLGRAVRRHKMPTEPAVAVLDAMFGDRTILAVSDVYTRKQDGQYQLDTERTGKTYGWRVVDVQPPENGGEVFMFVMSPRDEQYRYIPISTVKEFKF